MPRNASGVYTLPAGNPVIPDTIIDSEWANTTMADLGNEITQSLPRNGSAAMTGQLILSGNATNPLGAVTLQQMNAGAGGSSTIELPAGAIQIMAGNNAPNGWRKCNGDAISRTTYADLFGAIGVAYGGGNGTTTFNIPDLRATFVRGADDGKGVDTGRVFGSLQDHGLASHTHTITDPGHTHPNITPTAHSHSLTDPGHLHSMYVAAEANISGNMYGPVRANAYNYPPGQKGETDTTPGSLNGTNKTTGITLASASMSVATPSNTTGITGANATGITETRPRNLAMLYCIKLYNTTPP